MSGKTAPHNVKVIASLFTSFLFAPETFAAPEQEVIVVRADNKAEEKSKLSPGFRQEQETLKKISGATNLIAPEQENRLSTLQDALDYQPGILVQNFFGGTDQPRLNIRGSGVQSAPLSRGVTLLQDGIPISDADGNFHISTLDMRDARLISVRRGANSTHPQSNSLGGEMDFISYTGKDETGILRYEYGSFGREGAQAALGGNAEQYGLDGRLNVTYDHFDGYREHSASQRKTVRANVGYTGDNFENRTWLGWTDLRFDVAGTLSQERLQERPRSVYNLVLLRDPHRGVEQGRIANRSVWTLDNQSVGLGLWYMHTHDNFITPTAYILSGSDTKGAQLSYDTRLGSFDYRAALAWDHTVLTRELLMNRRHTRMDQRSMGTWNARAENLYAALGSSWQMSDDWRLNLDVKATHARRDADHRYKNAGLNQSWNFWTPKLGVMWQPDDSLRLYGNLSASNEPASFREILTNNGTTARLNRLKPQKGVTFEIGGDGRVMENMSWDVAIYRSIIKDEYITTYDASGTAVGVFNYADKTRHQGIEAGIKGIIPRQYGHTEYRLAWTYSDFRFMGGEYNGNYIAGIPRNVITAELLYKIHGWAFGPNMHWLPTRAPVDHANSMDVQYRDKYAVLGFKTSYQSPDGWSTYLTLDNLTDKRYATASVAGRVVKSKSENTQFPGMGFNVNGGVSYRF